MKYNIFAVYDVKADAYMTPFFMSTEGQAKRSFMDAIQNPELPFGRHPQDFTLFKIGTFNDNNGEVTDVPVKSLGTALELMALIQKNQQPQLELGEVDEIGNAASVQ